MPDEIESPTPAPSEAATPEQEPTTDPAIGVDGTAFKSSGEATGQSAPADETFYSGDPNTLPPQLREAYKNMLRDYKQKTQSVAEKAKQYESQAQEQASKAEFLDKLTKDSRFVDWYNSLSASEKQAAGNGQSPEELVSQEEWIEAQSDPKKFAEIISRVTDAKVASIENMRQSKNDASEFISAFSEAVDEKTGKKLRPDFDELAELGIVNMFLDKIPAESKSDWGKALTSSYKSAKDLYEKIYTKGKSDALSSLKQKEARSTTPPSSSSSSDIENIPNPEKLTVAQAVALARRGKVVARNF